MIRQIARPASTSRSITLALTVLCWVTVAAAVAQGQSPTTPPDGMHGGPHGQTHENASSGGARPGATAPGVTGRGTEAEPGGAGQGASSAPDIGTQRIGITAGLVREFTLRDAILLALQKNLDIEIMRDNVLMAQYNLFSARGAFDRTTTADINYNSQASPVVSIFGGGNTNSAIAQHTATFNLITNQQLERGGGLLTLSFENSRTTTTSTVDTLATQYSPSLTLSFLQPLTRNLSIDANRRSVQVAKQQLELSDTEFRQQVVAVINSVQHAYWDLYNAQKNERIARDALELARVQMENNRIMVEQGALAPVELRSTQAALEVRKGDVLLSVQNVTLAENSLKSLVANDSKDALWNTQINPVDAPQYGEFDLSLEEATSLALRNRPELEQLKLTAARNLIDQRYFKNQLRPEVDFLGIFGDSGLAGRPSSIPELAADVPAVFKGGYFQSLGSLFGQHFRTVQFGVRLTIPWRNHTAEGNLGNALAEAAQLDARQRQLVQSIQVEVRNALQMLATSRQRFEAAKAARAAAESQLSDETDRFLAGLVTNFFVLQRQSDLATARGSEVRALTDYNKALADVQRVTGLTLVSNNIHVPVAQAPLKHGDPSFPGAGLPKPFAVSH